jgi:DNA-binding transcriptional MerR regulator
MLTREDLVDRLRAEGVDVTPDAIALWQRRGLLPYPTKRRKGTATVGYYPAWVADLVRELRRLQAEGMKLEQIVPHLRARANQIAKPVTVAVPVAAASGEAHAPQVQTRTVPATIGVAIAPDSFGPLADALARIYRAQYGTGVAKVEIRLTDDRGNPVSFTFNVQE